MVLQKTHKGFTSYLQKHFNCVWLVCLLLTASSHAQTIVKEFKKDSLSTYLTQAKPLVNKKVPTEFAESISLALMYYPELESTHICFKLKKQGSPLAARPRLLSIFRKSSKRRYIISISNNTFPKFRPILLKNLAINSQIGVLGHELSHVSAYNKRRGFYFLKLALMHISRKSIDRFEYATDMRCIDHGLGFQLLSWSMEVRLKLHLAQWKGIKQNTETGRERYMNPESIMRTMEALNIYNY